MSIPIGRMPSASEEFCANQFTQWLSAYDVGAVPEWTFEPHGHTTAPDYYMTVRGMTYAVEVAIVERQNVSGSNLSNTGWLKVSERLRDEIVAECLGRGILHGFYSLGIAEALPDPRSEVPLVRSQIIDYVAQTSSISKAPSQPIVVAGRKVGEIMKWSDSGAQIDLWDFGNKWPNAEFPPLLKSEIQDKIHALRAEHQPCVVLFLDRYTLAPPSSWDSVIQNTQARQAFHSIFVIRGDDLDFMIYSQNPKWPEIDRTSFYYFHG
jgi:hypothetical protein